MSEMFTGEGGIPAHAVKPAAIVTGATGYIGGHLTRNLLQSGCTVYVLLRASSDVMRLPAEARTHVRCHICRFASEDAIQDILKAISTQEKQLVIYHLAAYVRSGEHSPADVPQLLESNVRFGTMLAEAARQAGINCMVNTGTYWQYYPQADVQDRLRYRPVNLYAATKQAYQDILRYYTDACGLHVINLLLYDTYGPAVSGRPRRKILDYLREHATETLTVPMSPGAQQMNYVYIDDVIRAYRRAGQILLDGQYALCGTYAVRAEQSVPLRQIVETYLQMLHAKLKVAWGARPYRVREVMVPNKDLPILPGWHATVSICEGLKILSE